MEHTAHGYWLDEAGAVAAAPSLAGSASADVVVIGGGYAGLWAAWQLRAGGASGVLLGADGCGHRPGGRHGGLCGAAWGRLPARGARRVGRAAGGRRVRPRPERAQRRLLRDAVGALPVAGRALRPRAGARGVPRVGRERGADRGVVRR